MTVKCVYKGRCRNDGVQMWKAFLYLGPRDVRYLGSCESAELAEAKAKKAAERERKRSG